MIEASDDAPALYATSDNTIARLRIVAANACPGCAGLEHIHTFPGWRVTGMYACYKWSPSNAIACFALSRGATVVYFEGYEETRFWYPTHMEALSQYRKMTEELRDRPQAAPEKSEPAPPRSRRRPSSATNLYVGLGRDVGD